jgi:hypothetical protein
MTINRNLSFVTVLFEGVKAFPNGTELNLLIVLHASHSCLEVIAYHISSDQESRLYIPCKKGLFPDPAKVANSIISRIEILELSETTLTVQISPLHSGDDGNLNFVIDSRPAGLIPLQTCFHFRYVVCPLSRTGIHLLIFCVELILRGSSSNRTRFMKDSSN